MNILDIARTYSITPAPLKVVWSFPKGGDVAYANNQESHRDALTMEHWSIIGEPVYSRREIQAEKSIQDDLEAAHKAMSLEHSA